MRKATRDAAQRRMKLVPLEVSSVSGSLDPEVKAWLDNVVIPILLKKLKQEWEQEKVA